MNALMSRERLLNLYKGREGRALRNVNHKIEMMMDSNHKKNKKDDNFLERELAKQDA